MKAFILYCAFAYGAEFSVVVNFLAEEIKYETPINILLLFILSFFAFILAPITFFIQMMYTLYNIIKRGLIWR